MPSLAEQNQTCTRAVQHFQAELPHKPQNSPYSIILESESHNSAWVMGVKHYSWEKKKSNKKWPPPTWQLWKQVAYKGYIRDSNAAITQNKHGFVSMSQLMSQCTAHACVGERECTDTCILKASHDKLNLVSSHQNLHLTQPLLNQQMSLCEDVKRGTRLA